MNIFEFSIIALQAGAIMLGVVIAVGLCLETIGYYFARARTRATGGFNSQAIISIMRQLFITTPLFVFAIVYVGSVLMSAVISMAANGSNACKAIWIALCVSPCVTLGIIWAYAVLAFSRIATTPQSWEFIVVRMREQRGSFLNCQPPLYPMADGDRVFLASLRGTFRCTRAYRFGVYLVCGLVGIGVPLIFGLGLISAGGWLRWPVGAEWGLLSAIPLLVGVGYYLYKVSGDSYSFDGSVIVQRRRDGRVRQELNISDVTSWHVKRQGPRLAIMHLATKHSTMRVVICSDMQSEMDRILQKPMPQAVKQPSDVGG